jgi:hypothetical protein
VLGADVSTIESLNSWVGFGTDVAGKVGELGAGEILRDVTRNDFVGSGGTRNRLKNLRNAQIDAVRGLSERVRNSLPYKLAPQLLQASEILSTVVDPLLVGDGRGAVSGVVDLGATSALSSAGSAGGEWLGASIGGTVGSFVPVVGNAVGAMVGGAVGTFAGGYLAAAGYDSFLKQSVIKGVEAGIAAIIDPDPLMQMIAARQAALYRKLPPEVAEMIATSQSFGGGEMQLQDWGRLVTKPAPEAMTQQQAALPDDLSGITAFVLRQNPQVDYPLNCAIKDARVSCSGRHSQGPGTTLTIALVGTVSGNTLDVENFTVFEATSGCTVRAEYRGRDKIVLEKGGRAAISGSHTVTQALRGGHCPTGPTTWSNSYSGVGAWRPN